MKYFASILHLSALVLLCGCNGGGVTTLAPTSIPTTTSPTTGTGPTTGSPPMALYISGNWQLNTTSTTGMPPAKIVGSIAESGGSVTGAVHVDDSTCFDPLTTIGLTGTLTGGDVSITSTPVKGQVITLTGTITVNNYTDVFNGTYTITGGCGDGDKGTVTGIFIYLENSLDGTFTTSQQQTFTVSGALDQYSKPSLDGSFGITGTAAFSAPSCLSSSSATITPGTLSSGSFILGTAVGLEFATGNGTITFLGTVNLASYDAEFDSYLITGNYTVSGGTCDGTGTAVLRAYNWWDY